MKKIILLMCLVHSFVNFGQSIKEIELVKRIKSESATFLFANKEIDDLNNLEKKIYIIEILEKKILGYNKIGVYRLFTNKHPSFEYIILKGENDFTIIDLKTFSHAIKKITDFLILSGFSDETIASYVEKIVVTYRNNNYGEKLRF